MALADPNTLVLLVAGASVGAGFPTSERLHELLLDRLDPIYVNLARLVFNDDKAVDPERLFRVMEYLNALETPAEKRSAAARPLRGRLPSAPALTSALSTSPT